MKHRILVVEDSETFRRPLQRTLEAAGYEVSVASTEKQVLGMLQRGETDLVLTDIRLPELDGLELLRRIKREYPPLPVVVMTAHGTADSAASIAQLGADHYLVKPFEPTDLLDAIRRAIARLERGAVNQPTLAPSAAHADPRDPARPESAASPGGAMDTIQRRPA
jgi:DNA-binding NtrC family response regulator